MKKLYFTFFTSLLSIINSSAQTVLFSENFNSGTSTQFALNTTDHGCVGLDAVNQWEINNAYTGGTGIDSIYCPNSLLEPYIPIAFFVINTPGQPSNITSYPNSYYLHIDDTLSKHIGLYNSDFIVADSMCVMPQNSFVKMNSDISTIGLSDINLSFWWMCGGDSVAYGQVYYSVDGGNTWALITSPLSDYFGSQHWKQQIISLPQFDNQPTLRFGFMWVNNVYHSGTILDPPFCLDDINITVGPPAGCHAYFTLYPDSVVSHLWHLVDESTGAAPFTYKFNWGDGDSTSAVPSHVYASAGMYNICMSITDAQGCQSSYCDSANVYRTDGIPVTVNVTLPGSIATAITVTNSDIKNMSVSPNPCTTCVVKGIEDEKDVVVTDILGRNMNASFSKSSGGYNIILLNSSSGIYLVRNIKTGQVIKFVKGN